MKLYFFIFFFVLVFFSCTNEENTNLELITERIQYDVIIKTPDIELDWWVQNIEGIKREALIKMIIDRAYEGKVQTYDFQNRAMSNEEVKNIGKRQDTLLMPSVEPPYEDSLVVINESLKINDITKLRFIEEWSIDKNTLQIEKKVLGMALLKEDFDQDGEMRGYKPVFWIYFDKRYPLQ